MIGYVNLIKTLKNTNTFNIVFSFKSFSLFVRLQNEEGAWSKKKKIMYGKIQNRCNRKMHYTVF